MIFKKLISIPLVFGLVLFPTGRAIANLNDYFILPPQYDEIPWWEGSGYKAFFVPKNEYTYVIEAVGTSASPDTRRWLCRQMAAVRLSEIQWATIKAQVSLSASDPNANAVAEGDVVTLSGKKITRTASGLYKKMHMRVVVRREGETVYKTSWHPYNAANLTNWDEVEDCEWVND